MAKFEQILQGTRARRIIRFPLANTPGVFVNATPEQAEARKADVARVTADAKADSTEFMTHAECAVRVLSVAEHEQVYQMALARTKSLGGEEGDDSHLYNYSMQLYTVALGYVDPESPPDKAELYFGATIEKAVENIGKSPHMSRDTLAMLAEWQETFQNECNPQTAPAQEAMHRCIEEGAKDASFFTWLAPGARQNLMHFMAKLLVSSQMDKSPSSSPSISEPETQQRKPETKPNAPNRRTSGRSGKKR